LKDELSKALESYNERLSHLKTDLEASASSAALIRNDIKELKKRYVSFPVAKTCDISGKLLLGSKFFVFPCGHAFVYDALVEENMKDAVKAIRIKDLKRKIGEGTSSTDELKVSAF
jgi:hypothetical protein